MVTDGPVPKMADLENAREDIARADRVCAVVASRLRIDALAPLGTVAASCERIATRIVREPLAPLLGEGEVS